MKFSLLKCAIVALVTFCGLPALSSAECHSEVVPSLSGLECLVTPEENVYISLPLSTPEDLTLCLNLCLYVWESKKTSFAAPLTGMSEIYGLGLP